MTREAGPPPTSLSEWLRARSDAELAELLRLRPDLALPAPVDLTVLASRVGVRTSVQRAIDGLDTRALHVLDAAVLGLVEALPADLAAPELARLRALALVWGDDDHVRPVAGVAAALGPHPAGLGRPVTELVAGLARLSTTLTAGSAYPIAAGRRTLLSVASADPATIAARLDACDAPEREVLDRLAAGPPIGMVRDALLPLAATGVFAPTQPAANTLTPPHRLIARGLLLPIDAQTVELPREVGLALRGDAPLGPPPTTPPAIPTTRHDVDAIGGTTVLEVLRLVAKLGESWSERAPTALRAGGLGARDLHRTAAELGVSEARAALLIEVAVAAGLLAGTRSARSVILPTVEFDAWARQEPARRWSALAQAWLAMTREPGLVGLRDDRERIIAALGPDVERGLAPVTRRQALAVLTRLAPGDAPADRGAVLAALSWQAPRRAASGLEAADGALTEADALGVTAAGALTSYGRALLTGETGEAQLAAALPDPVDHVLVQPDLTIVVPGPPIPELSAQLDLVADLESSGGASVYRASETSVRRALDAGQTAAGLCAFFTERSRTPVPQALTYLIEDVARRHGLLRAGAAAAYLRCDDPVLLDRMLADRTVAKLKLRRLAPTVVVSPMEPPLLLAALRESGYAPSAEGADGALITLNGAAPRAPSRPSHGWARPRPAIDAEQLAELVRRMRAGDDLTRLTHREQSIVQQVPGVTTAAMLIRLREAIRADETIWLDYVDSSGAAAEVYVEPISMAAGVLRGYNVRTRQLEAFQLHHIAAVSVVKEQAQS
ncbi:MAG: helicase-associated domain-containing protein [Actinomycetia bacterium]|nr:helicase-associated domain-containing protein [Actinomycetes bacterium]